MAAVHAPMAAAWRPPTAFGLAVFAVLIFSNGWQTFVVGPDGDPTTSSDLLRSFYIPGYLAGIGLIALSPWNSVQTAMRAPLLWLLIIIVFSSVTWSIAPEVTERRSVALLFTTIAAVGLVANYNWSELASVFATAFLVLALVSLVIAIALPGWGVMTAIFPGAWRGVWTEKNALGDHMALGAAIFVAAAMLNPRRRMVWIGSAVLALGLVILSTSKTSLIDVFGGACAFALVFLARRGPFWAVAATFVGVTGVLTLGVVLLVFPDEILGFLGKDATLTGRTELWAPIIRQAQQRPWTGYGYGAIWDNPDRWGPLQWITKQAKFTAFEAHDSLLEIWLGLGFVGLTVWCLYYIEVCGRAVLAFYRTPGAYLAIPVLIMYSLTAVTESSALNYNDFVWLIFASVALCLTNPPRRPKLTTVGAGYPVV